MTSKTQTATAPGTSELDELIPDDTRVIRDLLEFDTDELNPYHLNPRRGDVEAIARSLAVNGQYRPIVVNLVTLTGRPLEVLAGNHTLRGAKYLRDGGLVNETRAARDQAGHFTGQRVSLNPDPSRWRTILGTTVDVDDTAAARIVAADNRTADLGGYDDEVLAELIQAIQAGSDGDLVGSGYDDDDLDVLLALAGDEPLTPEDLQDALDEADLSAWPWVKVQLPPDTYLIFQSVPGEGDVERILFLLDRLAEDGE